MQGCIDALLGNILYSSARFVAKCYIDKRWTTNVWERQRQNDNVRTTTSERQTLEKSNSRTTNVGSDKKAVATNVGSDKHHKLRFSYVFRTFIASDVCCFRGLSLPTFVAFDVCRSDVCCSNVCHSDACRVIGLFYAVYNFLGTKRVNAKASPHALRA